MSPVLSKIGGCLPKSFFQTGFTSCQPQDQRRRFRSLVFFRLLWPTPRPNRCQDLQLALPQLSITPPVQPGAAPCVQHISIMGPVTMSSEPQASPALRRPSMGNEITRQCLCEVSLVDGRLMANSNSANLSSQRESWPIGP